MRTVRTSQERVNRAIRGASRQPEVEASGPGGFVTVFKWGVSLAVLGLLVFVGTRWVMQQLERPVQSVRIKGEFVHISQQRVADVVYSAMGSGFLKLDLHKIQKQLEAEPWVDRALVFRQWPDQLEVVVVEQKPIARWGQDDVLNHRGETISLAQMDDVNDWLSKLPLLEGQPGTEKEMMSRYHTLTQMLGERGVQLIGLRCDATGSWQMTLAGDVVVQMGKTAMRERVGRMLAIYDEYLKPRWKDLQTIDLRYFNGVAAGWKSSALEGSAAPHV